MAHPLLAAGKGRFCKLVTEIEDNSPDLDFDKEQANLIQLFEQILPNKSAFEL